MSPAYRQVVVALAAALLVASDAAPPIHFKSEDITRWIRQLGDDNFQHREEAARHLWEAGERAEAALQAVANSSDVEVARRAREILERFKWGIYPDTPKKIVELINRYQRSDHGSSNEIIRELFENGSAGCKAVLKIARAEEDASIRRRLFARIANEMPRAVPLLLLEDNFDTLSLLLETALDQDLQSSITHYTAFWLLRNKLNDRIAFFKARIAEKADDKKAWEVLAYLYRAKGDLSASRAAAEKAGQADLMDAILQEIGDWKALAARPVGTETTHDAERLGLQGAYYRLAGNSKEFEETIAALCKLSEDAKGDEGTASLVAKALFINDRPKAALEILIHNGDKATAFEVLVTRMQFREALKLVEAEREKAGKQLPELEILKARVLYSLGEKDEALSIFARYGDQIKEKADDSWFETLIDSECRVDLKDLAMAHAAKVLRVSKDRGWHHGLLPKLFPNNSEAAEIWWDYLRQRDPASDPAVVLKQIADVLEGKLTGRQLTELIEGAGKALKALDSPRTEVAEQWTLTMAEAALVAGQEKLARSALEKTSTDGTLQKLGDLLADKKQWELAAEYYHRAWEMDRQKPLTLFLWGRALTLAGQEKEGRRRMEQSHWLPLGNEAARHEFVVALSKRGLFEASRRENELLLRLSLPASYFAGEARQRAALEARLQGDYLQSADGQERSMLRCLRAYVTFVQPSAYVGVPGLIHRQRSRGFLAAGKLDDAVREATLCLKMLPGDIDLVNRIIPGLLKAGRKKEADELFAQITRVLDDVCHTYPKCAWAFNSAAWLSASCHCNLETGLAYARKAVELSPESAGYHDTLAEVYFQMGEKEKAIASQKNAIKLDSKKNYFTKQLKRIEAGNPSVPLPQDDEEDDD